jgi:hypothetical protein
MKRGAFFLFAIWLLTAASAAAAPFCVATGFGKNCWYYSRDACERAAASAQGACILNQEEMQQRQQQSTPFRSNQPVGAPFCVVTSTGNQCYYYNEPSCQRAARAANGYCAYNR